MASRVDIAVVLMIEDEVGAFEGTIKANRLVEHGDAVRSGVSGILCGGRFRQLKNRSPKITANCALCLDPFPRGAILLLGCVVEKQV